MAETLANPIQHIRHLIGGVQAAAMHDGELLERFLATGDETAVEVLVRRYGPLVLGACRRVLHNAQAAEDAFQATFLVLVRKASALDRRRPLGNWLYTVAYRLALRARANETRRRECEAAAARKRPASDGHVATVDDRIVALEEELQKLPERHRAPLVLCYLQGKTNEQVAEVLGCPRGSISARLAEARERLRAGLARRGYAVPASGIACLLTGIATEAAVPLPLLANTVRAAVWFTSSEAGATGFSAGGAVMLARDACRSMLPSQLKFAAAAVLVTALLWTGTTLLVQAAPQVNPAEESLKQALPEKPAGAAVSGASLPKTLLARMGTSRLRNADAVSFAAYTPDGKALVTAGRDQMVRLWDLGTGNEIRRFEWGAGKPNGKSEPAEQGAEQRYHQQYWDDLARSCQAALSADGKIVAASRRGTVCLWETASGKKLRQLDTAQKRLLQLAFAADGKSLLTLGPGQAIAIWDVGTGACVRRSQGKPAPDYRGPLAAISSQNAIVSPGLKYIAFSGQDDNNIHWIYIQNVATGKELRRLKGNPGALVLAFSADDKTLVWQEETECKIIVADVATGKELHRLKSAGRNDSETATDPALAIALSADGRSLAVNWMSNAVELWDLRSGQQTLLAGKVSSARFQQQSTDWRTLLVRPALAFAPDGKQVVCSQGGAAIRQFKVDTGAEIPVSGSGHRAPVSTLALSGDGKSLCTYSPGDPAHSWDWRTGKETQQRAVPASATHAVFTADGRFGFATGHDFVFCGPHGKKTWRIVPGDRGLVSLALSPGGALLATRQFMSTEVRLWDVTTGKERLTLGRDGPDPEGPVAETTGVLPPDVVFSPDGRRLAAWGPSRQLCLWDLATGTLLWDVLPEAGHAIERFAFSPTGRFLATVNADRTVTLYDAETGAQRARLGQPDPKKRRVYLSDGSWSAANSVQMRRDAAVCLAFSPDSRYLALAQHGPEIQLWDVFIGRQVGQLKVPEGGVVTLLFTPDGRHLISGGTNTTALTWDLASRTDWKSVPAHAARLQPQVLGALWADLGDKDTSRAWGATCKLIASPKQAVTLIKERVKPATAADPKRLAQLLVELESDHYRVRAKAEAELEGLGDLAESALRKALAQDPPVDLHQRLKRLLHALSVPTGGKMRGLRAVELLELIGNSDARQELQTLAGGVAHARLTREAASTLQRLTRRVTTP
jgi:RNA polymerase sigma factor (sigma-70 family)